jgi:hypothetical protein
MSKHSGLTGQNPGSPLKYRCSAYMPTLAENPIAWLDTMGVPYKIPSALEKTLGNRWFCAENGSEIEKASMRARGG